MGHTQYCRTKMRLPTPQTLALWVVLAVGVAARAFAFLVWPGGTRLARHDELGTPLTRYADAEEAVTWGEWSDAPRRPPLVAALVRSALRGSEGAQLVAFVLADVVAAIALVAWARAAAASKDRRLDEYQTSALRAWRAAGRPRLYSASEEAPEGREDDDDANNAMSSLESAFGASDDDVVPASVSRGHLSDAWLPTTLAAAYLLNPATVLSCAARSMASWSFACAVSAAAFAARGDPMAAGAAYAALAYLEGPAHAFALALPLWDAFGSRAAPRSAFVASAAGTASTLALASYWANGASWSFVRPCYLRAWSYPDLAPNLGLWFYLFACMFSRFRRFFVFALHAFLYVFAVPLHVHLGRRPGLEASLALCVLYVLQPYPELLHVAAAVPVLLLAHPRVLVAVRTAAPAALVVATTLVLQPVMLASWLQRRTGNANYLYFQTLACVAVQAVVLTNVLLVAVKRDKFAERVERGLVAGS